jgi:P27 family predicted phage terminase small subunit
LPEDWDAAHILRRVKRLQRNEMWRLQNFMNIQAPDYLNDEARVEFTRVVKLLGKAASELDLSVIADYAQAHADCNEMSIAVRFEGDVLTSDKGNSYANPRTNILMGHAKTLNACAVTWASPQPAARPCPSRVNAPPTSGRQWADEH